MRQCKHQAPKCPTDPACQLKHSLPTRLEEAEEGALSSKGMAARENDPAIARQLLYEQFGLDKEQVVALPPRDLP